MTRSQARGSSSSGRLFALSVTTLAMAVLTAAPARAEPPEGLAPFFAITEIRGGVFAANLEENIDEQAETFVNGEVLFRRLSGRYDDPILDILLRPRPHVGFELTPDEGGTQIVYAGVTWEVPLGDRIFVEASFGGAIHDGPTDGNDPNSYGCAVNFRESASLGFNLDNNWRLMLTVDHMSNGGLCDQNQGITNAGVRLGYRW